MATVGLCVITKSLDFELRTRLEKLLTDGFLDEIYVQVNGGTGSSIGTNFPHLNVSQYTWNDNFADARNALLAEVKTDYWVWMDTDDDIQGIENLRSVVDHMEAKGVDMMFAQYAYSHDADGIVNEIQNRERIIRTSLSGEWRGVIHETFIPHGGATRETTDQLVWVHQKDAAGHHESMKRNRKILESEFFSKEFEQGGADPRIAYYLGLNYGMDDHYEEAIKCFEYLIKHGGWDEERYRAWLQIFSCLFELNRYEEAMDAALQATLELPEWPDAYFLLQQVYYHLDDHQKALEWFNVGRSKPQPVTDAARNPVVVVYQPLYLAAYSYLATGQAKKAFAAARELQRLAPGYSAINNLKPHILDALNEAQAIDNAKGLIAFSEKYEGDARAVLEALPPVLRSHVALTEERRRLIPGKSWGNSSVVIFCGNSFEPWGPDTLDKGMGGSEEAIVYLSRALAYTGLNVTVFNERPSAYDDDFTNGASAVYVDYLPWTEINPNDEFDVFVAWRSPVGLKDIKARLKLCDVHDIISQEMVYDNLPYVDKYLFKSQFHRSLYPEVPDSKAVVIGNGISKEQFK